MNTPSPGHRNIVDAAVRWMEEAMSAYDPSHDKLHVHRVRQTALKLASQLSDHNPDLLVLELAAVFHDLLDKKYRPSNHVEGDVSTYDFFLPFFEQNVHIVDMVSSGQAELIVKIVDNVSWSTETALIKSGGLTDWHKECIELHCVQDADRLDAMGAIGIMRCAGFSCVKNRPLVMVDDFEDPASAVGHIFEKLLHIKDRLKTKPGREMGEIRHQFMEDFLRAIRSECVDRE